MPPSDYWETLFDVDLILSRMSVSGSLDLAEIGCGYGTFTIPAARKISGRLHAFDIDDSMVERTRTRAAAQGITNVILERRDTLADGTGLPAASVDYVMLFNILHHERPLEFLTEAARILKPGGAAGCIHWNYDSATPRGPELSVRPRPEQIRDWLAESGLPVEGGKIDLPPWHYGWIGRKP